MAPQNAPVQPARGVLPEDEPKVSSYPDLACQGVDLPGLGSDDDWDTMETYEETEKIGMEHYDDCYFSVIELDYSTYPRDSLRHQTYLQLDCVLKRIIDFAVRTSGNSLINRWDIIEPDVRGTYYIDDLFGDGHPEMKNWDITDSKVTLLRMNTKLPWRVFIEI
ncbi:hypothetical protein QAD02_011157 [Eretmocerus hayati]|uniref:Uncharacterized protein n=1 Tax=Eretmocerus hayati TaxID=131215 RepID=A0ACC2NXN7_9HYME|nr:hypothetical protein QAD02_011157 [Eretmocerus hayati]